jgi:hypothetical protein
LLCKKGKKILRKIRFLFYRYGAGTGTGTITFSEVGTGPEPEPNFSKFGTGTGTGNVKNSYGSTTLFYTIDMFRPTFTILPTTRTTL